MSRSHRNLSLVVLVVKTQNIRGGIRDWHEWSPIGPHKRNQSFFFRHFFLCTVHEPAGYVQLHMIGSLQVLQSCCKRNECIAYSPFSCVLCCSNLYDAFAQYRLSKGPRRPLSRPESWSTPTHRQRSCGVQTSLRLAQTSWQQQVRRPCPTEQKVQRESAVYITRMGPTRT